MLVLSPPALSFFEVLLSAVSSGCEARLRGRRLRRGPEGPEGQRASQVRVVCCLPVLELGWLGLA